MGYSSTIIDGPRSPIEFSDTTRSIHSLCKIETIYFQLLMATFAGWIGPQSSIYETTITCYDLYG